MAFQTKLLADGKISDAIFFIDTLLKKLYRKPVVKKFIDSKE